MDSEQSNDELDQSWWKQYFERKLELDREKIKLAQERHKDNMNFQKMALMLQERVEKVKVEAISSLTSAIAKLAEAKYNKWKQLTTGYTIKVLNRWIYKIDLSSSLLLIVIS